MKFRRSDFFIYLGSILLLIKTVLSASKIIPYTETMDQILSLSGAIFLIISILLQKYKLKTLLLYAIAVCLTLYNSSITGNNAMAITVVTCLAVRKSDIDNYIKLIFRGEAFLLGIHTLLAISFSIFGIANITQSIGGVVRYDFGMLHPNSFAALTFNLFIMLIWLKWDKIKMRHIVMMMAAACMLYAFCKTRTNLMTMLIVICLLFFHRLGTKSDMIIEKIALVITPLFSVLMAAFILLYATGNVIIMALNEVLNARISLGAYAFAHYQFTLFGQDMSALYTGTTWDSVWKLNAFTFDCIYSYMLINQGIIWLIILTILFAKLARRKKTKDNVAIVSWALYGLTEVQGLNCFSCTPIILLTRLLRKEEKLHG